MADQYTKEQWAAIQAGRAMAAAYQPGFNQAFPPKAPSGQRGPVGASGTSGPVGATSTPARASAPVGKYDPSRLPVFTRGAQTPEEQDAQLHSGNPAAMSLQQWGRAASNQAASRSKMKNRGDTTFYSGYGEDRFRLSVALRAPGSQMTAEPATINEFGQGAARADAIINDMPDANFDRMAPYLAKDAAGRELSAKYGEAVKAEKARQIAAKSTFDPTQYDTVEAAQSALSGGAATSVRGAAGRMSAALLTPEDRATIQANSMAKKLTAESAKYAVPGSVAPVFQAGPGGKISVINEAQLSEDARKRARNELERSKPAGWKVVGESNADGKISYKTVPTADIGEASLQQRNRQEAYRAATGTNTFRAFDAASKTNVFLKAGDKAAQFGITGEAPDGKVTIERTEVDASLVGALAGKARELMMNGDETDNVDALARAIELVAEERGVPAESLAKKMGSTPNSFEDTLSVANDELYKLLEVDSQQREVQAAEAAEAYKQGFKTQLEGPMAGELVASRIVALRGTALMGNPYAKDAAAKVAEASSTPALAATLAESIKTLGTNNGRFEDATTASLVRELEMVAGGEAGADPALVKALDASRLQFTKWGEKQIEAIQQKAAGNPFLRQQVENGAMAYNEEAKTFMSPTLSSQLAGISDAETRNEVIGAMPKDASGSIVGYTVGNPDIVAGKATNPAFNMDAANASLRKASAMAQGAASIEGLPTMEWANLFGNRIDSPFTNETVDALKGGVSADLMKMSAKGEDAGFSFEDSALPPSVKASMAKDPKLMALYGSKDPAKMSAAAAGAAADAWQTYHLSTASEVTKAYSGLVQFAEESGVLTPSSAALLFGQSASDGGFTAINADMALDYVVSGIEDLKAKDPEAYSRARENWDYYGAITDTVQNLSNTSGGDPRALMRRAIGMANDANQKIRKDLGSNAYGVDNGTADRILGAIDVIDRAFGIDRVAEEARTRANYAMGGAIGMM